MKQINAGIAAMLTGIVVFSGCEKKQEAAPPVPPATETQPAPMPEPMKAPVVTPQASTTVVDLAANARTAIEQAMALAKEGKYQEALALLQQKSAEVQANPEGKSLIDNAIAQIKQMMADAATKATTEKMGGAAGGMLGGLGK